MFGLFRPKPLLEDDSVAWMLDVYRWAMRYFDADIFFQRTALITPTNEHFPGRENSLEGMAQLIFSQVSQHAEMAHWPWRLLDQTQLHEALPQSQGKLAYRRGDGPSVAEGDSVPLVVTYHPQLVGNPEALIANYAQSLGHYLGLSAAEPAPASAEQWPLVSELLGIYLGFGLMFANTAFAFRGGCGSCKTASRTAYLSQDEATYALALFCVLKEIPQSEVFRHLKKHLRPIFKKAVKDIQERKDELLRLNGD